ncbi:peptidase T [Agromyces sp. CFH 90414]|uniref:Peptidase T n=1 Tax=Agromyces agglutinans TaxID=2662258 RepID=A0A6I2FD38_9MICO|nr:peptidase T [Agromyces agglutinans]MRG59863.1 peptidase T [Agromyces agglutinans]
MTAPRAPFTSPLAEALAPELLARFDRYVRIDTQSDRDSGTQPSSARQLDLSRVLVDELVALGLDDAELDEHGYVYATLPATIDPADGPVPVIGLIAHVDTSPDASGAGVEPIVHEAYAGGVIELPRGGTTLDPELMPQLTDRIGHDLVTSSGDTLLGADDKAGVAAILTAVAHLIAHPELPRPTLRLAFTPDEEIGRGAHRFDVDRFGAACAYTVDGSEIGELQDETFAGAEGIVTIEGHEVHPGFATGKLVNAARLAAEIVAALPRELTPERTAEREGFIHVYEVSGGAARAVVRTILRDFDDELLARHGEVLRQTVADVVAREPRARATVDIRQQYPNMRTYVEAFPQVTAAAEQAIRAEGLEPVRTAVRGGTDGSQLSAMGLPTPNLFTGGYEFHSVREWASVQEMAAAAATVVRLAEVWTTPEFRGGSAG